MFTKVPFSPLFPLHNFSLIKISSFASYVVMTSYLSSLEDHTPVQNPLECKCFFWNFLKMNYKLISCFHLTYSSLSLFLIPVDGMTSSCWSYKLRNDHGFFIFLLSSHLGNRLSHVGSIHFLSPLLSFLLTYWVSCNVWKTAINSRFQHNSHLCSNLSNPQLSEPSNTIWKSVSFPCWSFPHD